MKDMARLTHILGAILAGGDGSDMRVCRIRKRAERGEADYVGAVVVVVVARLIPC